MLRRRVGTSLALALLLALFAAPAFADNGDPYRDRQWGLDRIKAPVAWDAGWTGSGVTIAVVDTGVDLDHPDLAANVIGPGADFVEPDGNCTWDGKGKNKTRTCVQDGALDENGHGTHVAGIAAAVANNNTGVAGVAPSAKILPVRVLDEEGGGTTDQVAAGIRYAADQGVKVINLSLGFLSGVGEVAKIVGWLKPIYEAVDYAHAKGAVIVFAAGNDAVPLCAEPAANPKVLCVGATDRSDVRSWYSNSDATLSKHYVVAPGGDALTCSGDILSTYLRSARHSGCAPEKGYEALAGTSMAAPHVSGVAALLAGKGLTRDAIITCIESTSDDLGSAGRDPVYGYGRVNAENAVTSC